MPAVKKGESKKKYVKRAVSAVKHEHPEKSMDQILGQVYGMYKEKYGQPKKSRKRVKRGKKS